MSLPADTLNYTFEDLPVYRDGGTKIVWTVGESAVPTGYKAGVDGYTITNTHETKTTSFSFEKVWDDKDNQDGKRADFTVTLYKDTTTNGSNPVPYSSPDNPITLTPTDTSYTWLNLPVYEQGKTITWSIAETAVPDEYSVTYDPTGHVITNSYTPETTSVTIAKIWDDNNDKEGKRTAYTVTLYKDGVSYTDQVLDKNSLTWTWEDLPVYDHGETITWTVDETGIPMDYGMNLVGNTFTNFYPVTSFGISKVWDDDNNRDGLRDTYTVTLYKNGASYADKTLDKDVLTWT